MILITNTEYFNSWITFQRTIFEDLIFASQFLTYMYMITFREDFNFSFSLIRATLISILILTLSSEIDERYLSCVDFLAYARMWLDRVYNVFMNYFMFWNEGLLLKVVLG